MQFVRSALILPVFLPLLSGSGCTPAPTFPVRTYQMGDQVRLGNLVYSVFDPHWMTHLGDGASARVPESRFFVVRFSVTNSGTAEVMVPTATVTDDSGQTYTELSNGDQVPHWAGFLRRLKPAGSLEGNIVFDCMPRHYKLRIADENEQRTALIDLPLTLGAEIPEIPEIPVTSAPEKQ